MTATKGIGVLKNRWLDSGMAFAIGSALIAFCIPVFKNGIQIPIILTAIAWLFTPKTKLRINWKIILFFSSLWLFHLLGMLYTENIPRGLNDLEQKIALLVFPLLYGSVREFTRRELAIALYAFCAGTLVAVVIAFISSYNDYVHTYDVMEFYMSQFSPVHHPSYIALYMNFAIAALIIGIFHGSISGKWGVAARIALAVLAVSLVFPASKAGLINFIFLLVFLLFMLWFKKQFTWSRITLIAGITILFFIFAARDPVAGSRVAAAVNTASGEKTGQNEIESNQARLIGWSVAVDEISQHPFGVGTGDINDVLVARFRADGYDQLAESNLNPHNNYLQIALAQGIPAMILFVLSLLFPFRKIMKQGNWLYAFFLFSMMFNFLVESMLEKQSGVIFFAFFNALFYFSENAFSMNKPDAKL